MDNKTEESDLIATIGSMLSKYRWKNASKAEREAVGRRLGKACKQAWAEMTTEERSIEMKRRAVVREENRRKREEQE